MDINIHKALNYKYTGKLNFPHKLKQWEFQPTGSYSQTLGTGDTVRINVNSRDFLNPYGSFLEFVIDVSDNKALLDDTVYKNKILQLDSSAHSFINTMVVNLRGKEIERILQYDILGCVLKDIKYDVQKRTQKDYEGNGGVSSSSIMNAAQTSFQVPIQNNGTRNGNYYYIPSQDGNTYTDLNTRTGMGFKPTTGPFYTTINHSQNYSQTSFQPYHSVGDVSYTQGVDLNDGALNFSDNAKPFAMRADEYGCSNPYNPVFSSSAFEPWFSVTVPQKYLKSGFLKCDPPKQLVFQVPLISSFFGMLMPPETWKLVPLRYMTDLSFDFTFNQHALFTSFFSTDQTSRAYTVKKITLKTELIEINDRDILAQIENEYVNGGLLFASQAFTYGPNQTFFLGAVPGTVQINERFKSLRNLFFLFTSDDYMANTAFRKNYRLSMAITSIQLKIGTDYYPQQPITGNGGTNMGPINNNEFVKYLWKCFNMHCTDCSGVINQHNFAINCREANPTSTLFHYTTDLQTNFFHENRVIGKCVYGIPLDALNYEGKFNSGIDTTEVKPFDLNLTYDNSRTFQRRVTMHIFLHHDYSLYISPDNVIVMGK